MKRCTISMFAAAVLTVVTGGCQPADKSKDPATTVTTQRRESPRSVEETIDVTVTARVKAIDPVNRLVTLQGGAGHEVTYAVDERVRRLNEVKVGDSVKARCQATLLAELRSPTADEAANPIAYVAVAGRAPGDAAPAGGAVQALRIVTTVEAVDVPRLLVTLRGPMGDVVVVQGKKAENVRKLRVGDTIVITYAESVAIALDKVDSH